jgi:hypothetical protein
MKELKLTIKIEYKNPTANTVELEQKIDGLIYDLYGLSEKEVNVV